MQKPFLLFVIMAVALSACGAPAPTPTAVAPIDTPVAPAVEPTPTLETFAIPQINSVEKSQPVAYPKEIIAEDDSSAALKLVIPSTVSEAPEGTNVKLWLADPRSPERALAGGGIFIQPPGKDWYFVPAENDGAVFLTLESGEY